MWYTEKFNLDNVCSLLMTELQQARIIFQEGAAVLMQDHVTAEMGMELNIWSEDLGLSVWSSPPPLTHQLPLFVCTGKYVHLDQLTLYDLFYFIRMLTLKNKIFCGFLMGSRCRNWSLLTQNQSDLALYLQTVYQMWQRAQRWMTFIFNIHTI